MHFRKPVTTTEADQVREHLAQFARVGYLGGRWPNNLEPLPTLRKALGRRLHHRGDHVEALKSLVWGCAHTTRHREITWLNDLLDLADMLIPFVVDVEDIKVEFQNERELPKIRELKDLYFGHTVEVLSLAERLLGPEAEFTVSLRKWYEKMQQSDNGSLPGTRSFRRRFKAAHAKLLAWAGVDDPSTWVVGEGATNGF